MSYVSKFRKYSKFTKRRKVYPKRKKYVRKARSFLPRLRPEIKKVDLQVSTTVDVATPYITSLVNIGQGSDDYQRVGNGIVVKSLYGRMKLTPVDPTNSYRMLVVVDRQQVADTYPTVSELLDDTSGSYMIAPLNNKTVGRFTVLLDRILQADRSAASAQGIIYTSFYKKCYIPVRYNGTTSADVQKNGIYIFIITDDLATDPDPSILATVRTSYSDA